MANRVQDYIDNHLDVFRDQLFDLLRIPSISADSDYKDDLIRAAQFLKREMENIGLNRTELFETDGHPILYGELCPYEDRPVVLIYGHYDVQPPDPLEEWETPPFEPVIRGGRVYARGASDDKGQSYTHLKAIEAYLRTGVDLPVNVKFLFEGEEEIGSPNLIPFIRDHREKLACDMVLISDTAMFAEDQPSITYGLKGLAYMEVEVFGPKQDLHSGVFGGAIQNPANALATMIAKLLDEDGIVRIPGFYDDVLPLEPSEREAFRNLPFDVEAYRKELDVPKLHGEKGYSTIERATARPTLDVNGLWSGYQGKGAKTVLPARAGAKISMRIVPDQNPKKIAELFTDYIHKIAPDTVRIRVTEHHGGHPVLIDRDYYGMRAAADAFQSVYNREALFSREGGSIPIVADFQRLLGAPSILMGFGLSKDALHSPNESLFMKDFYRGIKTSAAFLEQVLQHATGQEGSG